MKAQLAAAPYYLHQFGSLEVLKEDREARYLLVSSAGDAWLHGSALGSQDVRWMDQEGGIKLQSAEPAEKYVEWILQRDEPRIPMNVDITIADLDPERRESL